MLSLQDRSSSAEAKAGDTAPPPADLSNDSLSSVPGDLSDESEDLTVVPSKEKLLHPLGEDLAFTPSGSLARLQLDAYAYLQMDIRRE